MTFLEKLKEDKPTMYIPSDVKGIGCPYDYGYEDEKYCFKRWHPTCIRCWNREMPNTEPKNELVRDFDCELDMAYDRGLNDAWELAKQMIANFDGHEILSSYTPQEALAKLKEYEEAHSKVVVGDVVNHREYGNGIVTIEDGDFYHVVCANGEVVCFEKNRVTKTGKHLDISSILEQIGE